MKQKVSQEQFDLMVALHTGMAVGKQIDTVCGMPVFEIIPANPKEETSKLYEVITDNKSES